MKALLWTLLFLGASQAQAAEYLIKYKSMEGLNQIQEIAAQKSNDFVILDLHMPGSYVVVDVGPEKEVHAIELFSSHPEIEWMHPNGQVEAFETVTTPAKLQEQWSMTAVRAKEAWEKLGLRGSKNVVVAVIDTGVDYTHPALAPNALPGFDWVNNDNDPMDIVGRMNAGHGTHCAGVIGATGLVDGGIVGIAPNVSIMPLRFLGPNGSGDFNNAIKAIDYAVENGAHVISASWGARISKESVKGLIEAVERASARGVVFVVAAANNGQDNDKTEVYPANTNAPNVISVAATNSKDQKPNWSNFGKSTVHVAAPGDNILSTVPKGKYATMSGTSMATPMVAGLVALLKSYDTSLTGAEIKSLLQSTGAKISIENACGCRIDAAAAADHLVNRRPLLVPMSHRGGVGDEVTVSVKNASGTVQFVSTNPEAVEVDESGLVRFLKGGTARIKATDAAGVELESFDFTVKATRGTDDAAQCPYGPAICRTLCRINPKRPYCQN